MTVLGDFVHIIAPSENVIFVPAGSIWGGFKFNTGGRRNDSDAFLMVVARNLQGSARVLVNGERTGFVRSTGPAGAYSTQIIGIPKDGLKDGDNNLEFGQITDQFDLLTITCFFHQNS